MLTYLRLTRGAQPAALQADLPRCVQKMCFNGRPVQQQQRLMVPAKQQRKAFRVAASAGADKAKVAPKPKIVTTDWQKVLDLQKAGAPVQAKVVAVIRGGARVEYGDGRTGFIPFSLMDPARVPSTSDPEERAAQLLGKTITAKIVEVNVPERRVTLSERAASLAKLVQRLSEGDVVEGVVSYVSDFGAFVMLRDPEGELNGAEGLIHISELSWEWVSTPDKVVQPGKVVKVKVVGVDKDTPRIKLSLKQMEDDPLKETLDDLVPVGAAQMLSVPASVPEEFEDICQALASVPGVSGVTIGRQAEEKRVVSQDLELWITRESVEDGFNLLARAGRTVQEIHVSTEMSRPEMKETIQQLLKRII